MSKEASNGQLNRALYWAIVHGKSIENIPSLVKQIIQNESWKSFLIEDTGEIKSCKSFAEYVTKPVPDGLGTDIDTLWRLCGNDIEAQAKIDEAIQRKPGDWTPNPNGIGGKSHKTIDSVSIINSNNIDRPAGTTRQYGLRRLTKSRPDLHHRVLAHEISVNAAMVEAGFRPKTITIPVDPGRAARAIKRQFTQEQVEELVELLQDDS